MKHEFWHSKWQQNEIGFHQKDTNPWLKKHLHTLNLPAGGRVFLPLCGKTRDIDWLLEQGFSVIGSELNESAVIQLFDRLNCQPDIDASDSLKIYRSGQLEVFVGDLFALSSEDLQQINGVFDRAALVALPDEMRSPYARHLAHITGQAPQLLICFEYRQQDLDGPPFSVSSEEIRNHYQQRFAVLELDQQSVKGGLKGQCPAIEKAWLLQPID